MVELVMVEVWSTSSHCHCLMHLIYDEECICDVKAYINKLTGVIARSSIDIPTAATIPHVVGSVLVWHTVRT